MHDRKVGFFQTSARGRSSEMASNVPMTNTDSLCRILLRNCTGVRPCDSLAPAVGAEASSIHASEKHFQKHLSHVNAQIPLDSKGELEAQVTFFRLYCQGCL